jgi:Fe-S cluster assembly protein SufD
VSPTTVIDRIAASQARIEGSLGGGPLWARRRASALAKLVARGLPDRRDENWKYLDHARLAEYGFEAEPSAAIEHAALDARLLPLAEARRIVLADGRLDAALSDLSAAGPIEIEDLRTLIARDPARAAALLRVPGEEADDRFALLADAFARDGAVIRVLPRAAPAAPLYVVHVASASAPAAHQSRLVVEIADGSELVLVEHFLGLGDAAAFGNLAAEVSVGRGARLVHVRLHEHGRASACVETWAVRLGDASRYDQHFLAFGGRLLRSNLRLSLDGKGAACRLAGLFLADGDRQVDLHTQIAHRGEASETSQEYRGIAADRGRGAFNGRIVVHPSARGANAGQTSRNLLLSPLAEINARPQLEIHANDVQCRHGATTGTVDEEQLLYLRSRGLDAATARALLVFAFCRDMLGRLPVPAVRAAAETLVAGALPDRELIRGIV